MIYIYSMLNDQERSEVFASGMFTIKDPTPRADRWWGPPSGYEDVVFPVTGEFSAEGIAKLKAARAEALAHREARARASKSLGTWAVSFDAAVDVRPELKIWTGKCLNCEKEFTQTRSRSRYGRWKRHCSDECHKAYDTARKRRERKRPSF